MIATAFGIHLYRDVMVIRVVAKGCQSSAFNWWGRDVDRKCTRHETDETGQALSHGTFISVSKISKPKLSRRVRVDVGMRPSNNWSSFLDFLDY